MAKNFNKKSVRFFCWGRVGLENGGVGQGGG